MSTLTIELSAEERNQWEQDAAHGLVSMQDYIVYLVREDRQFVKNQN